MKATIAFVLLLSLPAASAARNGSGTIEKDFATVDSLLEKGSYTAALKILYGLLADIPADDQRVARVHERTGAVRLREGKVREARAAFTAALKAAQRLGADDSAAKAYTGMGLCLRRENNDAYALKFFKRALKLDLDEGTRVFVDDQIREIEGDPPVPAR